MIDWTKPLELIDGTPVVLCHDTDYVVRLLWKIGPDGRDEDGHYWVAREDGKRLTIEQVDPKHETEWMHPCYETLCFAADGSAEGCTTCVIRNRESQP